MEKSIFLILSLPYSLKTIAPPKSTSVLVTNTVIGTSTIEMSPTYETTTDFDCKLSQTVALVLFNSKLEHKTISPNYHSSSLGALRNNVEITNMNAFITQINYI